MKYLISNQTRLFDNSAECKENICPCSIDFMLNYFKPVEWVQVDTETTGFFNHSNRILTLQLGTTENQFVIEFAHLSKEDKQRISDEVLNNPDKIKIFHNAIFDIKFIWLEGMKVCSIYDTMLAEKILNAGRTTAKGFYSLKSLAERRLGISLDKEIRGVIHREGLTYRVVDYAAEDVAHLESIKDQQLSELISHGLANSDTQDIYTVLGLENNAVLPFAEIEYNGIKLDLNKWKEIEKSVKGKMSNLQHAIDSEVINNPVLKEFWTMYADLFTDPKPLVTVNWNSPIQKLKLLKKLGDFQNTSEAELDKFKHKIPLAKYLIEYNKTNKLLTSFVEPLVKQINPVTGRIHTSFNQILNTGRVSTYDPNLQQIPSRTKEGKEMRKAFVPEEGYDVVGGDFSGCELRIIAEFSQDDTWLKVFREGGDLHSTLCAMTFDIPIEDVKTPSHFKPSLEYRDIQKTINFGLAYGMSEFKLASTIEVDVDIAKGIIDKFFDKVPKVKDFLNMLGWVARTKGRIKTPPPYRRIRWFDDYKSGDQKILGSIERSGKNHPIQGGNADLTKLSLVEIYRYRNLHNLPVRLIHTVHDEIQTECKKDYSEQWAKDMEKIMMGCGKIIVKSIPMKVDCKIASSWGDAK